MMIVKILLSVLVLLLLLFAGMLVKLAADSRAMSVTLGVEDGRLAPCPDSPNCVSSDAPAGDSHHIPPLSATNRDTWPRLQETVGALDGVELVARDGDYARYTFRTPLLGFIDDVEFLYRPRQGEIAVRSASRVGYGDMNANRKRIESLRDLVREKGL